MKESYYENIKSIVNNYDKYSEIAANLDWQKAMTAWHSVSHSECSVSIYINKYSAGYIQNNFERAFVQMILTIMGINEEWDEDYWELMPVEERRECLDIAVDFYKPYVCFDRICMQVMSSEEVKKDILSWFPFWNDSKTRVTGKYNHLSREEIEKLFFESVSENAMLLGGTVNAFEEENWLIIDGDMIMFVTFGCSG